MRSERAGKYVKLLYGEMAHKAFEPASLPPDPPVISNEELSLLIGKAHQALGKLSGITEQIPDIDLFVAMYIRKEATSPSAAEGRKYGENPDSARTQGYRFQAICLS